MSGVSKSQMVKALVGLQLRVEAEKEEKEEQVRLRAAGKDEKHNDQVRIRSDATTELTRTGVLADIAEVRE